MRWAVPFHLIPITLRPVQDAVDGGDWVLGSAGVAAVWLSFHSRSYFEWAALVVVVVVVVVVMEVVARCGGGGWW